MRIVWIIAGLIIAASAVALAWPENAPMQPAATVAPAATSAPAAPVAPEPPVTVAVSPPASTLPQPPKTPPAEEPSVLPQTVQFTHGTPAVVERVDSRTVRLDGQYTVVGSGSQGDPYRITWELLKSAAATIDPAERKFVLPGRLSDMENAWVEISGYWAPPFQRLETQEISMSLNKWDGCCLGVPPTPFDSIEVKLTTPVSIAGQHLFRFGTVRGRLHIEPFVLSKFLLGLYRIDEATLESS